MEDGRKNNGGARKGAGRPSKVNEEKANAIMLQALKEIYKVDSDDEAKIAYVKELHDFDRGKMFIAEHVFGKAKEIVETTHVMEEDLSDEDIDKLAKVLKSRY